MKKLVFVLFLLVASGCDFFSSEKTYDVRGRVVDIETGKPIEGIFVAMGTVNLGFYPRDTISSDREGIFRLRYSSNKKIKHAYRGKY